jgi:penicillin amidase
MRKLVLGVFVAVIAAFAYQLYSTREILEFGRVEELTINSRTVSLWRGVQGIMNIKAQNEYGFVSGLGYAHAMDRYVQLFMQRVVGQGRLCELLACNNNTVLIDRFMRHHQFHRNAKRVVELLPTEDLNYLQAYSDGINAFIANHRRPFEFMLTGYHPEPWTPTDTILISELTAFLGLAQSQLDLEKAIIEMIKSTMHGPSLVKILFKPNANIDEETIHLIKQVKIHQPIMGVEHEIIAEELKQFPSLKASNAWVVDGSLTESGFPIFACDPHLDVLRLPGIWYEVVAHFPDNYNIGITIPGVASILMGRTKELGYGFTYGSMDKLDYFIEQCNDKEECLDVDGKYKPLKKTIDQIIKKNMGQTYYVEQITWETTSGRTLETPLRATRWPGAGYILSRAYSQTKIGGLGNTKISREMVTSVKTVQEFIQLANYADVSSNWVVADRQGSIGYAQGGLAPDRKHAGILPVPGWLAQYQWSENHTVDSRTLERFVYKKGDDSPHMIVSANDRMSENLVSVNAHMGFDRRNRIKNLLTSISQERKLTTQDMKQIQMDVTSEHALTWMKLVRPIATKLMNEFASELDTEPEYKYLIALTTWDGKYDKESVGAVAFETWYEYMILNLHGVVVGDAFAEKIVNNALGIIYFSYLDKPLLEYNVSDPVHKMLFWQRETQMEMIERTLKLALHEFTFKHGAALNPETGKPWTYGEKRQVYMKNIFFSQVPDKIGSKLGIHYGPITFDGNRATPKQAQIFETNGHVQGFAASYRHVSDLATDVSETNMPGGVSGNILSSMYTNNNDDWLNGNYKTLKI